MNNQDKPKAQHEFAFSKEMEKKFARAFKDEKENKLGELIQAARHFEASRYSEAAKILDALTIGAPSIPELQELNGLSHYRLGNFDEAISYLKKFSRQTKSMEQYPVLADCYRGIQNYKKVAELWDALNADDEHGDNEHADDEHTDDEHTDTEQADDENAEGTITEDQKIEGRIVYAGSLADQGKIESAVKVLRKAVKEDKLPSKPRFSQIKQVYALADIYDQSGAFIKAKHLFEWVVQKDRDEETDASQRLSLMS